MKFKVGQMVKVVENDCNARRGDTGIVKGKSSKFDKDHLYAVEFPRFEAWHDGHECDGLVPSGKGHWINEDWMEPLTSFQEKLDRFMKEPVGFLVKSKEIADGLAKVFERNHMKARGDHATIAWDMDMMWKLRGDKTYVTYNYRKDEHKLSYGIPDYDGDRLAFLDVTLDELKEYLESAEDFKGNKQEDHMKITIETDGHYKTTAECNGITAESLCNPTDEFKLPKGVHMAVQRLLEKLEEDTKFHVGDIVEVVANEFDFPGNPVGLQGTVVTDDSLERGAYVKLPIYKCPLYFCDRELKLIRRGNN